MKRLKIFLFVFSLLPSFLLHAQKRYELNQNWVCMPSGEVKVSGETLSVTSYTLDGWKNAVVPGTVLTTQLVNNEIPDPFYGMNNELIPDIYHTGRDYYTWWFVTDFEEEYPAEGQYTWLTFRGINYSCDIYLNGQKVNKEAYKGMFLRKTLDVTGLLSRDGRNRLAVIVYPPDPPGFPNGGQGGDGTIARNVSHQYVAGWDWIQPIRDRNTGIWDKVFIEKTGRIDVRHPHVKTSVPGIRFPDEARQADAFVELSVELVNPSPQPVNGTVSFSFEGEKVSQTVTIDPESMKLVHFPAYTVKNPRLWWPAGYGEQYLYPLEITFTENHTAIPSDRECLQVGLRQIDTKDNLFTRSKEISVNGQRIFIKGGNWIISDAMLRFSPERYDAEIRYHRDMNLNLIRIWGGALTERPEFYEACDRYGLLVIQDFWFSGDCNGRWQDPLKADDQWTRRKYPDDHGLVLESAVDMIKMIRSYPSLAMWCGGNEIMPPEDILVPLRDSILPLLDGTRWFIDYSNSDEMSYNFIGGNGDGPYTIQPYELFWEHRTFPFNSEVGSVGVGDYESLERFLPPASLVPPVYDPEARFKEYADSVWEYHNYLGVGYEGYIEPYGRPSDIHDFTMKAQLVNYNQYRSLMEGFSSRMWDWYTGTIIWKTQNPWTSMRGQMYDCYLDPNACLYGLRKGSEKLHVMCNPVTGMIMVVNNGFRQVRDLMLVSEIYDMEGGKTLVSQDIIYIEAGQAKNIASIKNKLDEFRKEKGCFLYLQLLNTDQLPVSENLYWYPDSNDSYSGLRKLKETEIQVNARSVSGKEILVTLKNPEGNPVAFFNRIALADNATGKRILPAFYTDNYVSVLPGQQVSVTIEYHPSPGVVPHVTVEGWNVRKKTVILNE